MHAADGISEASAWPLLELVSEPLILAAVGTGDVYTLNPAARRLFGLGWTTDPARLDELLPTVLSTQAWIQTTHHSDADGLPAWVALGLEIPGRRTGGQEFQAEVSLGRIAAGPHSPPCVAVIVRQQTATDAARASGGFRVSNWSWGTVIDRTLRTIVPGLADGCVVDLVDEYGDLRRVDVRHSDPGIEHELRRVMLHYPPSQRQLAPLWRVLQTGRRRLVTDLSTTLLLDSSAAHDSIVTQLAHARAVLVPLATGGRQLGVLTVIVADPRRAFGRRTLEQIDQVAASGASAIASVRQQQLGRQASVMSDYYFSVIAHELRSPLSRLKARVEIANDLLGREDIDTPTVAVQVEHMRSSVDRLVALTNNLLESSWPMPGVFQSRPREMDLAAVVQRVGDHYASDLGTLRRLIVDLPSESCPALIDVDRIEQVIINLLDNAVKYSSSSSTICLRLARVNDGLVMTVQDDGIGLPPGAEQIIFEPFGRTVNAVRAALPGSGLGLYICRIIVDRHGGRIWAESQGEGRGTSIHVWLPGTGPATEWRPKLSGATAAASAPTAAG